MERENWHIFYLKVVTLITLIATTITTIYLAVTFGNYYALYETPYSVKFKIHELHRQYWSQYIYIVYLGCLLICDLITCLGILYNLNYIILFSLFHHLSLLTVKIYSGFELEIPYEHSLAILYLYFILHTVLILTLGLLFRKLDSVMELKEILKKESLAKEQEKRRLKDRNHLNDRLLLEYEQKYVSGDDKRSGSLISNFKDLDRRESSRSTQLEPLDIEHNPNIQEIYRPISVSKQAFNQNSPLNHQLMNPNLRKIEENLNYDSDGYLALDTISRIRNEKNNELKNELNRNQFLEDKKKLYEGRMNSLDDESEDIYFEPDCCDDYAENHYDYLKCNIDDNESEKFNKFNLIFPTNDRKLIDCRKQQQSNQLNNKLIDKSIQTNHSNSSNDVFYTANEHDFTDSNFKTKSSALKESKSSNFNKTSSRKIEYSTLDYNHKVFYESSV